VPGIVASTNVVADVVDERGQHFHGKGDRAIYTYNVSGAVTNQLLTLIGSPASLETMDTSGRQGAALNPLLTLDLVAGKVLMTGSTYVIHGTAPPMDTNAGRLPKDLFKTIGPK
jgi:hypothetical protein